MHGIPLHRLLDGPGREPMRVLAGEAGLAQPTVGVRAIDVPEALDRIRARELLVVADPMLLDRLLDRLLGRVLPHDPAGIALRVGPGVEDHLDRLRALAEERGLPVIELPGTLTYDDLAQHVYGELNAHQTVVLERIDALHQALSQLVLAGGDLDRIAERVAQVLDVGTMVCSTDGRERAAALTPQHRRLLDQAGLLDHTGRFRVERLVDRRVALPGGGEVRSARIAAGGSDLARLVCVSPDHVLGSDDVQALERSATVAALLITREQAVSAVENKYRGDFLRDIFLGRAGSAEFVLEHASGFEWDLQRPMVVISAQIDPPGEPVSGSVTRGWQQRFSAAWSQVCRARDPSIPAVDFSTEVVVLCPTPLTGDGAPDEHGVRDVVAELVAAVAGDRGGGRRPFSSGVSRVVTTLAELPAAYGQARRAAEVGRRIAGGRSTTWFDDLGLHRLLALVPDEQELVEFAQDVLGELARDTEEAADLRATLQHLLDTNLNVAEAARLQFFHYNTMRYRVSKLERMLGPFSHNPHLRLNIAVALQVLEMVGDVRQKSPMLGSDRPH